jgi:hypothetical protein
MSQYNSSQNGSYIRTKKVGTHTGNVTNIITYVIGDCCRVAGIIFRNTGFHFTNKVSAYVSSFCIDTTTNTGKQRNAFST